MINISIYKYKEDNIITGFTIEGHANYAPIGSDIVCAAVSAITQAIVLGINTIIYNQVSIAQKDGFLCCFLNTEDEETLKKSQVLLDTMDMSLRNLADQYSEYIHVKTVGNERNKLIGGLVKK